MNFPKFSQLPSINKARFSVQVFVAGLILSATFFLLLVDVFKVYTSSISILIIPKSEVTAVGERQILGNMLEFSRLLSFYDRMLALNPDVRDVASGLSADQRKSQWNKMLSIKKTDRKSSVINISITTARQADSELLAKKTARTLFDVSAKYYNVKTDLDMRIIDGPITKSKVPFWQGLLLASIVFGYGLVIMFGLLILNKKHEKNEDVVEADRNTAKTEGNGENMNAGLSAKKPWFDFSKFTNFSNLKEQGREALDKLYQNDQSQMSFPQQEKEDELHLDEEYLKAFEQDLKIKEMKRLTKQIEPDKYPNFPEMPARNALHSDAGGPIAHESKASAPDNLPIADSSIMEMFSAPSEKTPEISETKIEEEKTAEEEIKKEPTPEELKQRLNELLRGKI